MVLSTYAYHWDEPLSVLVDQTILTSTLRFWGGRGGGVVVEVDRDFSIPPLDKAIFIYEIFNVKGSFKVMRNFSSNC